MSLYEMTSDFKALFDSLEAIEESADNAVDDDGNPINIDDMRKAWYDTLDGMEMEIEDKLESIAAYIKDLEVESAALTAEKKALEKRAKQKDDTIKRLSEYVIKCMGTISRNRLDRPRALISISKSPPAVTFEDEAKFLAWAVDNDPALVKTKSTISADKVAIKKAIKLGCSLPGVSLSVHPTISIK